MSRKKGVKIVFFALCGNSTKFLSLTTAQEAAEIQSHLVGYACEPFLCEKGCPRETRSGAPNPDKPVYHIRGKVRPASTDAKAFDRDTRWSAENLASFRERKATAEKPPTPQPDAAVVASRAEREEYVSRYREQNVVCCAA